MIETSTKRGRAASKSNGRDGYGTDYIGRQKT